MSTTKHPISDLLPAQEEMVNVQGKAPQSLRDEVGAILSLKNLTWGDFLTAAMRAYLLEHKGTVRTRRQS